MYGVFIKKIEYTFNINNELTTLLNSNWNESTSQWISNIKFDYTYDTNGNPLLENYSSWNESTSQWINSSKQEYTFDYAYGISDLLLPNTWGFIQNYPENLNNMLVNNNRFSFFEDAWLSTREEIYYYSEVNVGISEIDEDGVKVFPIPASEYIYFNIDKTLSPIVVEIIDIQGRIVLNQSLSDTHKISVQELKSGMYMYKLVTTSGNYIGKILIE